MEKEYLIDKISKGLSIRKISEISGKSYTSVRHWLDKFKLKTNGKKGRNEKDRKCRNCKKDILGGYKKIFCDNTCQQIWTLENVTLKRFENGDVKDNKTLRKLMILKLEYKCNTCGIEKWNEKEITLQVDHIDGNHKNNNPGNLRFLCPNCHTQTDNWGIKNKGNGRRLNKLKN